MIHDWPNLANYKNDTSIKWYRFSKNNTQRKWYITVITEKHISSKSRENQMFFVRRTLICEEKKSYSNEDYGKVQADPSDSWLKHLSLETATTFESISFGDFRISLLKQRLGLEISWFFQTTENWSFDTTEPNYRKKTEMIQDLNGAIWQTTKMIHRQNDTQKMKTDTVWENWQKWCII